MSIIVKGEPMPEACAFCPCFRDDSIDGVHAYQCKATFITYGKEDDWIWNTRPNWCPLVELPETHGRLIDADKLIDYCNDMIRIISESDDDMINIITSRICYAGIIGQIINMATIFESEGE